MIERRLLAGDGITHLDRLAGVAAVLVLVAHGAGCDRDAASSAPDEPRDGEEDDRETASGEAAAGTDDAGTSEQPSAPEQLSSSERELVAAVTAGERIASLAPGGLKGSADCGRPTHVQVSVGRGDQRSSYAVTDCDATFRELHERTAVEEGVDPYTVEISPTAIVYRGDRLFDVGEICQKLAQSTSSCGTDFVEPTLEVHSLVGPILSFGTLISEAGGGGPPYHAEDWTTTDVRSGDPAALDALVTEKSLVAALKADPYLQRTLDDAAKRALAASDSLSEALEAWDVESLGEFGAYTFHSWDDDRGRAAMRVAFRAQTAGLSPNKVSKLGLWAVPNAEAEPWFKAAARKRGFFAGAGR